MQSDCNDGTMSLDWTSLGLLVRRRAMEAVALHFCTLADAEENSAGGNLESVILMAGENRE